LFCVDVAVGSALTSASTLTVDAYDNT
jgi:hypothetical protein